MFVRLVTLKVNAKLKKSTFYFKKFKILHDNVGMKVGTDGVLLGAWLDCENKKNILDIGAGTGLISIMLAQRNKNANITAIDIEKDAYTQALDNVALSPYAKKIKVLHAALSDFNSEDKFDLLVSNPPFFLDSLESDVRKRNLARHTSALLPEDLFMKAKKILISKSEFALIFPFNSEGLIETIACKHGFFIKKKCLVYPTIKSTMAKRVMWQFTLDNNVVEQKTEKLIIEKARHDYTAEYIRLTRGFYLKMK